MALTNTLLNPPKVGSGSSIFNSGTETVPTSAVGVVTFTAGDATSNSGHMVKKYTITAADLVALGAYTTGIITLDTLPAGTILQYSRIKHSVAVGIATSLSARGYFASTDLGGAALDVFAAVGTTVDTHEKTSTTPVVGLISGTNALQVKFTNGGANLSTVTAGSIDFWVQYTVLS